MAQVPSSYKLLGEILVQEGAITREQLDKALAKQGGEKGFLGQTLTDMGYLDEESLTAFLAKYCRIPYLSLLDYLVDDKLLAIVPKELCIEHSLLPIDKLGKNLTIAIVDPLNKRGLEQVQAICPDLKVKPVVCAWNHFKALVDRLFREDVKGEKPPTLTPADSEAVRSVATEPPGGAAGAEGQEQEMAKTEEMESVVEGSMENTYEMLARRLAVFHGLQPSSVAAIFGSGLTKEFEKGDIIFEKGDTTSELYVILGGEVVIRDGVRVIATLSSGEMFGEMALVSDTPRSATAVAAARTSVLMMNEDVFQRLLTKQVAPRLLLNMLRIISKRLLAANQQLAAQDRA